MSALCLYVSGLIVATPLQGGGENFRLALCRTPDQIAETASAVSIPFLQNRESNLLTSETLSINF